MHYTTIERMGSVAENKVDFMKRSIWKYLVLSVFSGIYVGFGVILSYSVGAPMGAAHSPAVRPLMGATFAIALTLVIFAGSELFTGNTMVITIGWLEKRVLFRDLLQISVWAFLGNLIGSVLLAWMFVQTGLPLQARLAELILLISKAKMTTGFSPLFFRAILCNMLVCLAVWASSRTNNDAAKLIIIWWCIFGFVGSALEHSVANMSLLATALMIPHNPEWISLSGFLANLIPVTLGNIVGGALFIGAGYWFASRTGEAEEEG